MSTERRYLTYNRYQELTGDTSTSEETFETQATIAEALVDDVVGPQPRFHPSRTVKVTSATSSTFTSGDLGSDKDDYYNDLRARVVQGTGAGQETRISDYSGSTKLATVSPTFSTPPDSTSVVVLEQVGVFPRWHDRDADGRPRRPEALERAVACAVSFALTKGGTEGFNASAFNTSGGKKSEQIGSYAVEYESGSSRSAQQLGERAYEILDSAGLINDTASLVA